MLNTEIRELLDKEYTETLKAVSKAAKGTEEAKWELQKLTELHKQRMNEEQTDREFEIKNQEIEIKNRQIKEGKADRIIKVIVDGMAIAVPCVASSYWMAKGLKFEETGSFTSRVGNWVSSHFRMFKK